MKRGERVIKIYSITGRRIIAQFEATSLKAALTTYFETGWKGRGWKMKMVGNTMQVYKGKSVRSYRALELEQKP